MNLPQSQASSSSPWSTCCISVWCSPWSMYCIVVWCSPCSLGCTTFVFIGCSFWKNQYDPLLKFSLHHWHFVWCSPWNPVWISVEFSVLYCIMRPYRRYMCLVSAHARKDTYAHEKDPSRQNHSSNTNSYEPGIKRNQDADRNCSFRWVTY